MTSNFSNIHSQQIPTLNKYSSWLHLSLENNWRKLRKQFTSVGIRSVLIHGKIGTISTCTCKLFYGYININPTAYWIQQDHRRFPAHHLGQELICPKFQTDNSRFLHWPSCYTRIICISGLVTTYPESIIYLFLLSQFF